MNGTYPNFGINFTGSTGGGGGGQIFYLNLSQSQGSNRLLSTTGSTASEQSTGVTISNGVTGTIASFQSQPLNTTLLPGGIWSFYLHSYKENTNASFNIFVEVYKRTSGGTQTLLFTTDPAPVTTNSPNPSMQLSDGYFSGTPLSVSDSIVAVVRATNTSNQSHIITLVSEGSQHYSYVVSTLPSQQGLTCDTLSGCSIIQTIQTDVSNKLDKSGGTITGNLIINSGLTATTISATTYSNLPSTPFLPLSGGTVTGATIFTGGLTANTISATTYSNLPISTSSTTGVLSSSDWTTFNNKQSALSGTTNFITKWNSSTGLTNSIIFDNGTNISIGSTSGTSKFTIESSSITATTNDTAGILLKNPILATSASTQQHSPAIIFDGNAWRNTSLVSQNLKWKIQNTVTTGIGVNVEGKLDFMVNSNNAGWVTTNVSLQIDRFGSVSLNAPNIAGGVLTNLSTLAITKANGGNPSDGFTVGGTSFSTTSGTQYGGDFSLGSAPTTGTMVYNTLAARPTINQTGSANGITRGLLVSPTLTNAVDFRGIEVTNGSIAFPITSGISATYAVKNNDYMINVTGGTFTVTLPTAVGCSGRIYIIKNSGAGIVTLATTSSQTIDGVTTKTMAVQYSTFTVMSNGSNWMITSQI